MNRKARWMNERMAQGKRTTRRPTCLPVAVLLVAVGGLVTSTVFASVAELLA